MLFRCIAVIVSAFAVPAMLFNGPAGAQATAKVSVGATVPTLDQYKAPASKDGDKPRGPSGMAQKRLLRAEAAILPVNASPSSTRKALPRS
jgi:hypothetical protein